MKQVLIIFNVLFLSTTIFAQGFICAVGGGSEDYGSWSDEPYSWIVDKSDSGKILVLSYSDQTNWIPDYFVSLGASSAENLKIYSTSIANQQSTYDKIIAAKAIFIKGGDQWQYINYWKGTKAEEAIKYLYENGGVIAGTSAGAMVLGEFVFTAKYGSAYSKEALKNPFNSTINIENNFLNLLPNVVFDTHFIERGRFGRLIGFMFNTYNRFGKNILGIGIDDHTAFCIDDNMIGRVFGSGAVSIFQKDERTIYTGSSSEYSIENLRSDQLLHNWTYDLNIKQIVSKPETVETVIQETEINLPLTDLWLSGTNNISQNISNGISSFLNNVNSESVCIITNQNYIQSITGLINYLNENSIKYETIISSMESIVEEETVAKLNKATCLIFIGDDLKSLSDFSDTTKIASREFYRKIEMGIPIYSLGNTGKILGDYYIDNADKDIYASYYGSMTNNEGLKIFSDLIFQPLIFENSDYEENRTSALLLGLMRNRKKIGVYCNGSDYLKIDNNNNSISTKGTLPLIIVDTRNTNLVDSSHYITKANTRQVVGMNNLRYTISNNSNAYSINEGKLINLTSIKSKNYDNMKYYLNQNYPNPFNSSTRISFDVSEKSHAKLDIYNLLGEKILELVSKDVEPGTHYLDFDANNYPIKLVSGTYFYSLYLNQSVITKKMIYLK